MDGDHWWVQFPTSFPHVSTPQAVTRFFIGNRADCQRYEEKIKNTQEVKKNAFYLDKIKKRALFPPLAPEHPTGKRDVNWLFILVL